MQATILLCTLVMTAGAATQTTSVSCYTKGSDQFKVNCSATQNILIHSVETQSGTDCATDKPGAKWNSGDGSAHDVFSRCNMRKEKCQSGTISSTRFVRINYTCVDDLSSIRRYDWCADVTSGYGPTPIYITSPGYPAEHNFTKVNCYCILSVHPNVTKPSRFTLFDRDTLTRFSFQRTYRTYRTYSDVFAQTMNGLRISTTTTNTTGGGFVVKSGNFSNLNTKVIHAIFHPMNTGSGYFWLSLESEGDEEWTIRCNAALSTSPPTQPTTTASDTAEKYRWYSDPFVYIGAVLGVAAVIIIIIMVVVKGRRKGARGAKTHMQMTGQSDGVTNRAATF